MLSQRILQAECQSYSTDGAALLSQRPGIARLLSQWPDDVALLSQQCLRQSAGGAARSAQHQARWWLVRS